ncbi:Orotate phosphoribosyltransferase [Geodia barretti]|uniref:orotate phosphoribosyltransferase n=1 Tax=Geodia barretti TaxID=519541 RepID=A0AA35SSC9_GEOBA|nr:Orotate phosphoribosyltransferase [Geodia barretti]
MSNIFKERFDRLIEGRFFFTTEEPFEDLLRRTKAVLEGHFVLSSGLHSSHYIQCARTLQHPKHAEALGGCLADRFQDYAVDAVISPALGGLIIGHETGRALGARAIFGERDNGAMTLRRGFGLQPGERVVIIEDVITTGGSVRGLIRLVEDLEGIVVGVGAILDRSGGQVDLGVPLNALLTMQVPTYQPEACPLCQQGSSPVKPGSRQQGAGG